MAADRVAGDVRPDAVSRARQMTLDLRWQGGVTEIDARSTDTLVLDQLQRLLEYAGRRDAGAVPNVAQGPVSLFLHGAEAAGPSALLFAFCDTAFDHGLRVACLPGRQLAAATSTVDARTAVNAGVESPHPAYQILEGLEELAAIAIDAVDALTPDPVWAEALFGLINRCHACGTPLLFVSRMPPDSLECPFPDLRSRLIWGGVYAWEPQRDASLALLLEARARDLGLAPPAEVVDFLLAHGPREALRQLELFDELATRSLSEQRRLSRRFAARWWRERTI